MGMCGWGERGDNSVSMLSCERGRGVLPFFMNRCFLLALICASFLAGCATLPKRDRALLDDYGVSGAVYEKMLRHQPLTLDDIVYLSNRKVPGPFIVHYLQPTYVVYKLNAGDVARLRTARVPEGVIRYLAATPTMFSPNAQPLWYQDDAVYYDSDYLNGRPRW